MPSTVVTRVNTALRLASYALTAVAILGTDLYGESQPAPLPADQVIERLSLKLRGTTPTPAEVAAFAQAVKNQPGAFMDLYGNLVDDYLASPGFRNTVQQIHSVWWKVAPQESVHLAGYIVANDHPYFELFERNYIYLDGPLANNYIDQGIRTDDPLPEVAGDWRAVRLSAAESRFRSIFSNLDFLNTFPDTATNKNRKRASQIFHTFLCENLAPTATGPLPPPPPDSDPHGRDPNCIGCHYRLDPLARFFDHWRPQVTNGTWYDPAPSALGSLILLNADGSHTTSTSTDENGLAQILAAEPRVHACIAKQVWSYMMGASVVFDADTAKQLVAALDVQQNYKDLVRATLLHPYFWSNLTPPPPKFQDVSDAFKVCTNCHSRAGSTSPQFDPSTYPFAADPNANVKLLTNIWAAINYASGTVPMPLAPIPALPADTLASIRAWIAAGANDNSLQPSLTDAQINEVLNGQ